MPTPHPQGRSRHTDAENGLEDAGGDVEGLSEQHGVCEQPGGGAGQHGAHLGALTTRWAAGRSRSRAHGHEWLTHAVLLQRPARRREATSSVRDTHRGMPHDKD